MICFPTRQFSILLALIVVGEIAIGIGGYMKRHQLDFLLKEPFDGALSKFKSHEVGWKMLQAELECCGVEGPTDWQHVFHNETLPAACCKELPAAQHECDAKHSFQEGCKPKLKRFMDSKALTLVCICAAVVGVQLIGMMFACCLYQSFRRDYEIV